ncbi:hypothetical protein SAMN05216573_103252 [Bradyrhizobium sp. Rc3b]|uniref:hypothetical protein n=1 Tax=unclassified Bradyrhizobium TaxID=2631580 RepID=UPI0008E6F77B|nr:MULTISPECIES: hypothetical protein [unclassified Bradyrhizobium]MBB4377489.1 hypothetical protein [Bradyrhizobium sp. SBR1B]SFM65481.1 hypothetical protein SAMN05216573_103252 [Bradyrhizobium sp. Rc3b]
MSRRRWIGIVVAALAVPVAAGFFFVVIVDNVMSGFGACRIVRQRAFASPSGSQLVVVVWKSCGATVPDSTQASIIARGRTFSPESTPTFLSVLEHQDVLVAWSSEHAVRIGSISGTVQIYKRDQRVGDVTINYE